MQVRKFLPYSIALAATLFWGAGAFAQKQATRSRGESGKIFYDQNKTNGDLDSTDFSGSLALTTMFFTESGGELNIGGAVPVENASNVNRFFTDMRARIDAKHISGSNWDFKADLRARITPGSCLNLDPNDLNPCNRFQSGSLSGNEIDINQLYVRRDGGSSSLTLGRQFISELTYTQVDGIRYDRKINDKWKFIGFTGLYPALISRDIRSDYPVIQDRAGMTNGRSLPVVGGAGLSYRYKSYYGSFGGTAVLPLAEEIGIQGNGAGGTGEREKPRGFVTSQGYWKPTPSLDVYHSMFLDVTGAAGAGLTNLSLGVNFRPVASFRSYIQATRVSTDILNTNAQSQLEAPGNQADVLQNNIAVRRIAQNALRGGITASFQRNRFEVSTILTARQRPGISITSNAGNTVEFPAAKAADITVHAVDKKFFGGFRLGGSISRTFGFGGQNLNRGNALIVRVDASRSFLDGKVELDTALTYLTARDETRADMCVPANIETCYGSTATSSIGLAGTGFFRFADNWFVLAGLNVARQSLQQTNLMQQAISVPPILMTTFFGRLAYRF